MAFGGASGGEQIVDDQHALAFLDGVLVHLERIRAVFERVIELHRFGGQFAYLAHGNKSGIQTVRESGGEDKSARLHAKNEIDFLIDIVFGKPVDNVAKPTLFFSSVVMS